MSLAKAFTNFHGLIIASGTLKTLDTSLVNSFSFFKKSFESISSHGIFALSQEITNLSE